MASPAFTPGKFKPVITLHQTSSPDATGISVNYDGLEDVAKTCIERICANVYGYGTVGDEPIDAVHFAKIARNFLKARISAETLAKQGVHTKFTSQLINPSVSLFEPLAKAYNVFGPFKHNGIDYASNAARIDLCDALIELCHYSTDSVGSGSGNAVQGTIQNLNAVDTSYFTIGPNQAVQTTHQMSLRNYIPVICDTIAQSTLLPELRLELISSACELSTETQLQNFSRRVIAHGIPAMPARTHPTLPVPQQHIAAAAAVFGQNINHLGNNNVTVPNVIFNSAISNAVLLINRIAQQNEPYMNVVRLLRFESGTAAQLATYNDGILESESPISLSDATAVMLLNPRYSVPSFFASAPKIEADEARRLIVDKSLK